MLFQLGNVQFEVWPLNAVGLDHVAQSDFAEKAVVGRRPPLEFVGQGAETHTIQAKLFPERLGGLSSLQQLQSQRASGRAFPFMRGDGSALGHYVIEKITERSTYLDAKGVGRVIEVDIEIKRSESGGSGSISSIFSIFG